MPGVSEELREELAGILFDSFGPGIVVDTPVSHGLVVSKLLALVEREKAKAALESANVHLAAIPQRIRWKSAKGDVGYPKIK